MGVAEMVEKIKSEAKEESEKIIHEAKENAKKELEEAMKEIEAEKKRFLEAEERRGIEEKERIVRAARQKARKLRWMAEEEMIEKTLDETLKRIKSVKSEGFKGNSYPKILKDLIKDSAISIAAGSSGGVGMEVEVILSEEDAAASYIDQAMLRDLTDEINNDSGVNLQLSLSDERTKSAGGVVVRRKDGGIEVNNTFEERMARLSTSLREEIMKTLFPGRWSQLR
ncbi:MAG: V-type ATP synthase subunit E [Candidatus Methanospirareceae archaeon]